MEKRQARSFNFLVPGVGLEEFSTPLILVKKAEKRKANDEPTDPETPRNKGLKYDREKRTRTFQNSWIDKFPWVVFD
jgi:hypothetical protein